MSGTIRHRRFSCFTECHFRVQQLPELSSRARWCWQPVSSINVHNMRHWRDTEMEECYLNGPQRARRQKARRHQQYQVSDTSLAYLFLVAIITLLLGQAAPELQPRLGRAPISDNEHPTSVNLWITNGAWELHQRQAAPGVPAPLKASSHPSATGILQCELVAHGRGPGTLVYHAFGPGFE